MNLILKRLPNIKIRIKSIGSIPFSIPDAKRAHIVLTFNGFHVESISYFVFSSWFVHEGGQDIILWKWKIRWWQGISWTWFWGKDFFFLAFMFDHFTNSVADLVCKCADRWSVTTWMCLFCSLLWILDSISSSLSVLGWLYLKAPWNTWLRVKKTKLMEMFSY